MTFQVGHFEIPIPLDFIQLLQPSHFIQLGMDGGNGPADLNLNFTGKKRKVLSCCLRHCGMERDGSGVWHGSSKLTQSLFAKAHLSI